jgi:hypothetical protein
MLGRTSEVMVSRFPLVAVALATVVAFGVTGCDGGGSSNADKPHRSTTTSSVVTTTTTVPGSATTTTQPGGGGTTTTTAVPIGTCGAQTDAILAAIGDGPGGLKENAGKYTVQHCRLAPSSPIYAAANTVPNPGVQLDGATVVLERIGALWNVDAVGTSQVGCNFPAQVISELGLVC